MEPINLGIAGLGRAGWGMQRKELKGREDKFGIVAGCDIDEEKCNALKEEFDCQTYKDLDEMLRQDDIELVSIATRSTDHVDHAIKALKSGKDVFLEKPIALTWEDAQRLPEAAKKAEGNLYFRHNRRFEPAFQHIREIIDSGVLGNVYEIKLRRQKYQRRDDWQTLVECGGGQLNNWGPHIIDHALRFLESPVEDVWSDLKRVASAGDAEDHLKIVLRGENGRVVDLEISVGAALPEPEYIIFGDKGALTCDGENINLRYLDPDQDLSERRADAESPEMTADFGSPDDLKWIEKTIPVDPELDVDTDSVWDYLYAAIREGEEYPISMEEALEVVRISSLAKKGTAFEPRK